MIVSKHDIDRRLRQLLSSGREERREITLDAKRTGDTSCIDASGAINLVLADILPTADNNLGLPKGLDIETGVRGSEVWPVEADDVEIEEEGEVGELTDQTLSFKKQQAGELVRTSITVLISNQAIDSALFDLTDYVRKKFQLGQRKYIASHLYSNAHWDGNCGPFSSANASAAWSEASDNLYESIMSQMTALEEEGFNTAEACIVMDYDMEMRLKYTPIVRGEGRMMIEDGKCCGYDYVANDFFNTELDDDGKLVKKDSDAIGIAVFKWFKIAQHGDVRLIIDGVSEEMAVKNLTAMTISTDWSFTDLSARINGGSQMQAFRTLVMDRGYLADVNDLVFQTSDGYLLTVGVSNVSMGIADSDNARLLTSDGDLLVSDLE